MAWQLPDGHDIGVCTFHADGSVTLPNGMKVQNTTLPPFEFNGGKFHVKGSECVAELDSGERHVFRYRGGSWWQEDAPGTQASPRPTPSSSPPEPTHFGGFDLISLGPRVVFAVTAAVTLVLSFIGAGLSELSSLYPPESYYVLALCIPFPILLAHLVTRRVFAGHVPADDARMTSAELRIWRFFDWHKRRLRFWLIIWSLVGLIVADGKAPHLNVVQYAVITGPVWILAFCLHSFADWRTHLARLLFFWCLGIAFEENPGRHDAFELWIGRPGGVALMLVGITWLLERFGGNSDLTPSIFHRRGKRLSDFEEAERLLRIAKKNSRGRRTFLWGDVELPEEAAHQHFLVVGTTGSGKTLNLRLLMQSVFAGFEGRGDNRALIYDAKQDTLGLLAGMNIPNGVRVATLNPFDARGVGWDMAADITDKRAVQQAAAHLIPEPGGNAEPFWTNSARVLTWSAMLALAKMAPGRWTFRDLLLALQTKKTLRQILALFPHDNAEALEHFEDGGDSKTLHNIRATLSTALAPYHAIAAAWDAADDSVSLAAWKDNPWILVLGNDEANRAAIDPINRVILDRLADYVLGQDESFTRFTWFFLDEVRKLGRLHSIDRLLTNGRSKGACVAIGFQDIDGLKAAYGNELAYELVGMCASKAFLRIDSTSTAEWAARVLGEREVIQEDYGMASGPGGQSWSRSQHVRQDFNVLPSELAALPFPDPKRGFEAYYDTPFTGPFFSLVESKFLKKTLRPPGDTPNFIPRDSRDFELRPWDDADLERLGLKVRAPRKAAAAGEHDAPDYAAKLRVVPGGKDRPDSAAKEVDDEAERLQKAFSSPKDGKKSSKDQSPDTGGLSDVDFDDL